ncbi:MAG TPA: ACP S-malonyltransferase [Polyangiaceae bacterium LLY-WYZ-15_(1-7)]|nr:[acyl-carrier-protein] S-malonyltransferase [Sandaracinus sp.]HJL04281.1 ACP S-malonyltransferase [Polyangiaceae bacterium LLY-WYZ-15_(1-7)]MBJ74758.1 [acyl-carrier-protein] S-malonyltransferase [Sandaracinus sp.]HJL10500.1 ACP S-malonyltransferase [Polyangiaceae bacterium LLY-WYZ-15_(1-7)]HJL21918.1 ACP S-malonyltransferase [Polyangiaceae bacterium LLY-WYZ-15_(1-7)]
MGKVAFVFPGQGSQKVGMGQAIHEADEAARAVFAAADEALGESLSALCFEGPEEQLKLTANTQPAVVTTSIALYRALGEAPDVTAGHSLGEYSAHVAAGTIAFEDAVRLVRRRGQYMQEAVPVGEGAMAAVMKASRETVERVCAETEGVVEAVNYNSPQQIVIAGAAGPVAAASEALKGEGARAMPLPVSAPFHSSLMKPAEECLAPDLAAVSFSEPAFPVYVNVDAAPAASGEAAREALVRQVSRAVRWEETVRHMVEAGVTLFVEVGPGKVLSGLIRRIEKGAARVNVEGPDDLEAARAAIAEHRASG